MACWLRLFFTAPQTHNLNLKLVIESSLSLCIYSGMSALEKWGKQDLNLRPAGYESAAPPSLPSS
jgi:hypothetical protein